MKVLDLPLISTQFIRIYKFKLFSDCWTEYLSEGLGGERSTKFCEVFLYLVIKIRYLGIKKYWVYFKTIKWKFIHEWCDCRHTCISSNHNFKHDINKSIFIQHYSIIRVLKPVVIWFVEDWKKIILNTKSLIVDFHFVPIYITYFLSCQSWAFFWILSCLHLIVGIILMLIADWYQDHLKCLWTVPNAGQIIGQVHDWSMHSIENCNN